MARGKIILDADMLREMLQMPEDWQIQCMYASPEFGTVTLIVTGDFEQYQGRGVPDYRNANHIEVRCCRSRLDETSPWSYYAELKPEVYRKEQGHAPA